MTKKKGIILAGGAGTRLYPLTKVTNKCLLPMGKQPMINHLLDVFLNAHIRDIMIVTSPDHMGHIVGLLGSGAEWGCNFTYKVQDESNGIAAALGLCEDFGRDSKVVVILGDNIFQDTAEPSQSIIDFLEGPDDYHLFLKEVPNPQRFGVPVFDSDGKIVEIVEKPADPPSNLAVTGLYMYTDEVFNVIKTLKPSSRGEYEISDVNTWFVKNKKGSATTVKCQWIDAGTFDSYHAANVMVTK